MFEARCSIFSQHPSITHPSITHHGIRDIEVATTTYLDHYMPRLIATSERVRSMTGDDAAEGLPQLFHDLEATRLTIQNRLSNTAQKDVFEDLSMAVQSAELDRLSTYAAEQIQERRNKNLAANLALLLAEAGQHPMDEPCFQRIATTGLSAIFAHYKVMNRTADDMIEAQTAFITSLTAVRMGQ